MTIPITVVIPVGPTPEACAYLPQAIESVAESAIPPALWLIDDMHNIGAHDGCRSAREYAEVHRNAWNLGVGASFNVGVSVAPTEHVLLLGADDWLEPDAIAKASATIEANPIENAYYWYRVRYSDDRAEKDQGQPCGAAVVTKSLWRATGGFPVESAVGRSDVMFLGMLFGHPELGSVVEIQDDGRPPYNYRVHDATHTASRAPWVRALDETAQAYWTTYQPPRWGRYE